MLDTLKNYPTVIPKLLKYYRFKLETINLLESNLRMWKNRYLTFEGKSLIIKAFGLSQSIYSLQVLEVRKLCIIRIERSSFGFLWIGCRSEKEKGIDKENYLIVKKRYRKDGRYGK